MLVFYFSANQKYKAVMFLPQIPTDVASVNLYIHTLSLTAKKAPTITNVTKSKERTTSLSPMSGLKDTLKGGWHPKGKMASQKNHGEETSRA
jgi:hypothetical protein